MTAKEKATELVDRFIAAGCLFANAKHCAIIAVDEIINAHPSLWKSDGTNLFTPLKYWTDVKKEINSL